jgi:hypothetical protein
MRSSASKVLRIRSTSVETRSSTRRSADPRAQIVRRAIEHGAHAEGELLDLVQHAVDLARQGVDLVVGSAHRQPLRQVAAHDLRRHRRDRAGLGEDAAAHPKTASQAEQQGQHHRRDESPHHEILDVLALLNVVPHQHLVAARQRKTPRPHFVFAGFIAERNRDFELDPLSFIGIDFRPCRNVAGHRAQLRIHHQIHGAADVLVLRALLDELDEIAARQHQDLLAQALHFRFDEIVRAAVDDT